ncbi:hypothetical protein A3D14_02850 [Candidatus Saccharibacteria bacterium RIFCSPHIGHO2_02_FULL_47_12]|nr:MAG: hypothetical protein A3D14_02850 [Candidatus Saccharibacteria bacterium RIFCSPHIGHO2_02_FULL_47_12]
MADEGEHKAQDSAQTDAGWQFKDDDTSASSASTPKIQVDSVQWSASEFIEHSKSAGWYMLLAVGGLLLAGVVYVLTKDVVSTAMVVIVAAVFGVFAARRPRVLNYSVNGTGINVGNKYYPYSNFKSFSIVREGNIGSIWLMPLKRFMPVLTIYFEPADEPKIIGVISQFLPVEASRLDAVDKLMHRLRF